MLISGTKMQLYFQPTPENPYAWDYSDNETGIPTEPYDELGAISLYLRFSYHLACLMGGLLSFSMLYLVLFKTTGHLKSYSRMLLLCSATDIMYWFMDNMIQMKAKLEDGVFMVKLEGPASRLPYAYHSVTMALYVVTLAWIHSILPAQYFFRYYAVTRSRPMTGFQTAALYMVSLAFAIPMGSIAYPCYAYSPTIRPHFNYGTLWYREVPLPKVLYADIRYIYQKLYFLYSNVFVTSTYVLSLYYAYGTIQFLKHNSDMYSERTKAMQKQLSRALFFQSCLPVILSIGPILLICVPSFFYLNTGRSALVLMNITSWVPVFNPLLTISVIVPYRRAVVACFAEHKVHTSSAKDTKDSSAKQTTHDNGMDMMM
ncbi:unnamed protein product [Bursaphelenchus xylophilus]|uniref:(pine wood nematode) hypothetical protein n=1 Tax=Bursaphelenchus xylophilus TaxID=6326 RepID=A0A1I7RYW4_BURXY|nr:unnamed protein product [Bursaphelenchus xylophilus]CAG9092136.1 unnamed protein product [Bursaphelenchus xylophilus]